MNDHAKQSQPEPSLKGAATWVLHRLEVPPWGIVAIVLLALAGWRIFSTTSRLDNEVVALDHSVRVLASLQSQSVQNLIHDLLTVAVNSAEQGNATTAEKVTDQLTGIVKAAKDLEVPIGSQAFAATQSSLDKIWSSSSDANLHVSVSSAKSALDDYKKTVGSGGDAGTPSLLLRDDRAKSREGSVQDGSRP